MPGASGEPLWPAGFVGSISHCPVLAGAIVGRSTALRSIGLDLEQRQSLTPGMRELICANEGEAQAMQDDPSADLTLFSIKEAVLKAWSRLSSSWPEFTDIEVVLGEGRFASSVSCHDVAPTRIDGFFAVDAGLVCAVAQVPAGDR